MTDQPADHRLELTVDDIVARAAAIAIALSQFIEKGRDHNQQLATYIATFVKRLDGPNSHPATAQDRDGLRSKVRTLVVVANW